MSESGFKSIVLLQLLFLSLVVLGPAFTLPDHNITVHIEHIRKVLQTDTPSLSADNEPSQANEASRNTSDASFDNSFPGNIISSLCSFGSAIGSAVDSFFRNSILNLFGSSGAEWKKNHLRGIELAEEADYAQALPFLEKALSMVPDKPCRTKYMVLLDLAECLNLSGDSEGALQLISSLPVAQPDINPDPQPDTSMNPSEPWKVPVLIIKYFPLPGKDFSVSDEAGLDRVEMGFPEWMEMNLGEAREKSTDITLDAIKALENGSRYLAYRNPDEIKAPSLKYLIVDTIERTEAMPVMDCPFYQVGNDNWTNRRWIVDYEKILKSINIKKYVEQLGVKEVWIWGYHREDLVIWESNMASPSGDVSNSANWSDFGKKDLPILNRTYTVFTYNITRGLSEVIEDHTHQLEAILRNRDYELFWNQFVGYFPAADRDRLVEDGKLSSSRRCGWAHFPPNGERDYDWNNSATATSDFLNWKPDGGQESTFDSSKWNGNSFDWFTLWRQTIPGKGNQLHWKGKKLNNWWYFIANWDHAIEKRIFLTD
ncbi:MAG: hypothetical protein CVV64_14595 [Candidatus Wallbacteria bacterium HGW-Wallbacteria-1]|jgi:hypothetical protein|uniref:Tetratricopeptide repeat protein n=1 Tax=Candidatus Wallbacteria bacterium HGW-Wallbacteria-1 TaxID=2013854 RepID=A0A2N1PLZ0_9BACT|nr:MAG: hypothetical protein CVV64_14595 [Candidatus Wallbacteria bacterium HGW-Wallbacteria-1]